MGDDILIEKLAPLYCANEGDLSVVAWSKDTRLAKNTRASCLLVPISWAADYADEINASMIVVDDLNGAFLALARLQREGLLLPLKRVNEKALHPSCNISPNAFVGRAQIAQGVFIAPGAFIGNDVILEEEVYVSPGAVIQGPTRIGPRSKIGSNSVIGGAAFSEFNSLGGVKLGAEVELGALCTVDRGLLGLTSIMDKSRLDNMVHCGHDVFIGKDVIIAAQSALAGFAQVHDGASIGGKSGVAPQVVIGKGARLSAVSFAHCDIKDLEIWSGNPSLPHSQYLRAYARDKRYKSGTSYGK